MQAAVALPDWPGTGGGNRAGTMRVLPVEVRMSGFPISPNRPDSHHG